MNKKEIYAAYGIEYKAGKINAPEIGWINPLLVNGNAKLGKGVWTWSMLPGTAEYSADIDGTIYTARGTCPCNCQGCYAQTGFYRMASVIKSLVIKTWLARHHLDFVRRAIMAQIAADKIELCRIHAAGDFFGAEYIGMWSDVVKACAATRFWTYTKNPDAETAYDSFDNCNVVRSIVPGCGLNFGHCDYIARVFNVLKAQGKSVHICKCGVDENQHCINCKGCSEHEYVLFIEHSTDYKAADDPAFPALKAMIENQ